MSWEAWHCFYMFAHLLSVWLDEGKLDSCICFCICSAAVGCPVKVYEEYPGPLAYVAGKGGSIFNGLLDTRQKLWNIKFRKD